MSPEPAGSRARVFVALPLPEALGRRLAETVAPSLRTPDGERPRLRFPRPEGLHLTLFFIGDVPGERAPAIVAALAEHLAGAAAPELELEGTGGFPSLARPRVLWVGAREREGTAGRLADLRERTLDALDTVGIATAAERRGTFRPHVTVARVGRLGPRSRGAAPPDLHERLAPFRALQAGLPFRPTQVALLESVRTDGPQRYEALGSVRLASFSPE